MQIRGTVGVAPGAQAAALVGATPTCLEITSVRLRASALVAQFSETRRARLLEQRGFGVRVSAGGIGDHRDLLGRELTTTRGVRRRRKILQPPRRLKSLLGLTDRRARRAGQLVRGRTVAVALP